MRIELENLAAMRHASVEIDGITVVAGENDTGKSTVSKALWCMFDSFYKYEEQFDAYRRSAVVDAARTILPIGFNPRAAHGVSALSVARYIEGHIEAMQKDPSIIRDVVASAYGDSFRSGAVDGSSGADAFAPLCEHISRIVSYDDARLMCGVLENNFLSEFAQQPCNVDEPGEGAKVTLTVQGEPATSILADNQVRSISSLIHLDNHPIYIDDSFILDDVAYMPVRDLFGEDRHMRLRRLLSEGKRSDGNVLSAMIANDKLSEVFELMEVALSGELTHKTARKIEYVPARYSNPINARNISAGMKTFAILQLLMRNGSIKQKSTIILDEPEVHLHPEWQLVFAEIIVLLQKAFDLHVLLATHSPYFLRAIQVYAAKHSIANRCRYYQSSREGKWCDITEVTGHTEQVFEQLVRPFEKLEWEMSNL